MHLADSIRPSHMESPTGFSQAPQTPGSILESKGMGATFQKKGKK